MQIGKGVFDAAIGDGPKPLPPHAEPPLESDTRNPATVALSKLGTSGGKARAKSLSKKRQREMAKNADRRR